MKTTYCPDCGKQASREGEKDYCKGHWIEIKEMEPLIRNKGRVENGKLIVYDKDLYDYTMSQYEDKDVDILIEETKEEITISQHGYFRGGVIPTAARDEQFGGWTQNEIVAFFKEKHLSNTVMRVLNGKEYEVSIIPSLANIGRKKMGAFVDAVIRDLNDMGIEVMDSKDYNLKRNKTKTYGQKSDR